MDRPLDERRCLFMESRLFIACKNSDASKLPENIINIKH